MWPDSRGLLKAGDIFRRYRETTLVEKRCDLVSAVLLVSPKVAQLTLTGSRCNFLDPGNDVVRLFKNTFQSAGILSLCIRRDVKIDSRGRGFYRAGWSGPQRLCQLRSFIEQRIS